jgi:hypothetical protein
MCNFSPRRWWFYFPPPASPPPPSAPLPHPPACFPRPLQPHGKASALPAPSKVKAGDDDSELERAAAVARRPSVENHATPWALSAPRRVKVLRERCSLLSLSKIMRHDFIIGSTVMIFIELKDLNVQVCRDYRFHNSPHRLRMLFADLSCLLITFMSTHIMFRMICVHY